MRQIEEQLHALHALRQRQQDDEGATTTTAGTGKKEEDGAVVHRTPGPASPPLAVDGEEAVWAQRRPIALVDEVSGGSPALLAGLRPGDAVLRFGSVGGWPPPISAPLISVLVLVVVPTDRGGACSRVLCSLLPEHDGSAGDAARWLGHMGQVVRASEGREVSVWVRRGERHLRLGLVPRKWSSGPGLVGCVGCLATLWSFWPLMRLSSGAAGRHAPHRCHIVPHPNAA